MKLSRPKKERGFTLIELLVAIGIGSIILGAVYGFYRSQNRSYILQDQIAEMQQNTRVAMNMLVRDIRMAGYELSSGGCTYYDTTITDTNALTAFTAHNNTEGPDGVEICFKYIDESSTISTTLSDEMPNSSAELKVESIAGFNTGDIIMISDGEYCTLLQITSVQSGSLKLQHNPSEGINPPGGHNTFPTEFAIGTIVSKIDQDYLSYSIANNNLMLDPDGPTSLPGSMGDTFSSQPVAENIEDLQLQYGLDINGDDAVDSWVNAPAAGSEDQVRSVRIWVLGRTRQPDPKYTDTNTYNMGDRVFQPNDGYRRRVLYSEVRVRNLGL